jgi:hypothetical protein
MRAVFAFFDYLFSTKELSSTNVALIEHIRPDLPTNHRNIIESNIFIIKFKMAFNCILFHLDFNLEPFMTQTTPLSKLPIRPAGSPISSPSQNYCHQYAGKTKNAKSFVS